LHPRNERKVETVNIILEELPDRNSGHQIDFGPDMYIPIWIIEFTMVRNLKMQQNWEPDPDFSKQRLGSGTWTYPGVVIRV
jgi:hypothetical protein